MPGDAACLSKVVEPDTIVTVKANGWALKLRSLVYINSYPIPQTAKDLVKNLVNNNIDAIGIEVLNVEWGLQKQNLFIFEQLSREITLEKVKALIKSASEKAGTNNNRENIADKVDTDFFLYSCVI